MKQEMKKLLPSLLAVAAGNFLYAFTVKAFLLPADLVTGGTTGIALTMEHLFGVQISLFVLLFNVAMLLIGWRILGRGFALTTLGSTFLYPLALEVWDRVLGDMVLTDDLLLCTVFTGLGIGVALGSAMGNIGLGMCLGSGIGICLGVALGSSQKNQPNDKE